jgi:hypothetical protein
MTMAAVRARLSIYRKPTILGLSIFGCVLLAWLFFIVPTSPTFKSKVGFDAYAYWVVDPLHPYLVKLGELGSFTYSPAFAQIASPIHFAPFYVFFAIWDTFLFLNLVWLTRRMSLAWLVFLPVPLELFHGNVHLLLATVCVLGFEYPALWSIGLLTKVTPGVSLLWFVVRREWRSLAWALGATAAISAVSFVIAPSAWFDWVRFLTTSNDTGAGASDWYAFLFPPLWLRIALAGALVVWGARTDRRWVVPVATVIAMPVIWVTTPAVLMAIPRLRGKARRSPDTISSTRSQALDSSQSSRGALAGES